MLILARFQAAPIFGSGMVLQRGKNIFVFGTGEEGVVIRAEFCGFMTSCTVTKGVWKVIFPPMGACRHMNMTLTDTETGEFVYFSNVAIGEVWLAGGQDNMGKELCDCAGGEDIVENDTADDIRYFKFPKRTRFDESHEEDIENAEWTTFSDKESARHWSAAAYFCAKELSASLDVTVGIIGCSWNDTSIASWMDRNYSRGGAAVYFDEVESGAKQETDDKAMAEYEQYLTYQAEWNKRSTAYSAANPNATAGEISEACAESNYSEPQLDPHSPGVLFDSMISFVAPYTLGGVLWYQGEADASHPYAYYTMMTQLITNWRDVWGDDKLPFIIGQLPMYAGVIPDDESWCIIREAQMRTFDTIRNTGIVVLVDINEHGEASAASKQIVGHRFAMQALDMVYGGYDGAFAPSIKNAIWRGDTVELQFEHAQGGFKTVGDPEKCFEICGADGVYHSAYVDISGERIFVSSEDMPDPCGVRYLWNNCEEVSIFSSFGLPLAPFRISKLYRTGDIYDDSIGNGRKFGNRA